tara:strand:+ start:118 stop:420 length:303 start_codon:yes stop_codon:yes gene_type:complete
MSHELIIGNTYMTTLLENTLGVIYNICFIGCFWPQIYKSIKSKSVEDVSIILCYMSIVGYAAALGYAMMKFGFDYWLCINYILSGISVMAMIAVYYKYKK